MSEEELRNDQNEPKENPFSLSAITSSHKFQPMKTVIYGVPGVGKTTFASTWEKPVLIRTEDGASALDIPTFPKVVESIGEFRDALMALLKEDHNFKTLIIDSLDWLEPLVWQEVCREASSRDRVFNSIEDFGYGKGYYFADQKWRGIQQALDLARTKKNMHIVAIAHAVPAVFDPPDQEPYMKYGIKLNKRAASLWTEWAEMLLFLNYQISVKAGQSGGKSKAIGDGGRLIFTQEKPAYLAKSRWPLPDSIFIGQDKNWTAFHQELAAATNGAYQQGGGEHD